MLRAGPVALFCLALSFSMPARADVNPVSSKTRVATAADLPAAQPAAKVTNGQSGTTTYFGSDAPKAPAVAAKPVVRSDLPPTVIVKVDLAKQKMSVAVNGETRYVWPISSGVSQFPTPTGTFRPSRTEKVWYSRQYDMAPMPNAVFINGGVAVHATYQTAALGSPASHGCIRLAPANAKTFYNLVQRQGLARTRVSVFGRPNWRDQVAIGRSPSRKSTYAEDDQGSFFDSWGGNTNSAFAPEFTAKKLKKGYVIVDGVPRKVSRRKNGDVVLDDRQRRRPAYKKYGFGYGGPGNQ